MESQGSGGAEVSVCTRLTRSVALRIMLRVSPDDVERRLGSFEHRALAVELPTLFLSCVSHPVRISRSRFNSSTQGEMTDELHFLILHYLASTPCAAAAEAFSREALAHGLLPRRHDPFGNSHVLTYEQCKERYSHVEPAHLLRLIKRVVTETPTGQHLTSRGVSTLLGSGSSSLLRPPAPRTCPAPGPVKPTRRRRAPPSGQRHSWRRPPPWCENSWQRPGAR